MAVTVLIVAGVAVAYAVVMGGLVWPWRRSKVREPAFRPTRTSIEYDPDNRYPFMSGDAF